MPFGLSLAIAADPFGSTERMEISVSTYKFWRYFCYAAWNCERQSRYYGYL